MADTVVTLKRDLYMLLVAPHAIDVVHSHGADDQLCACCFPAVLMLGCLLQTRAVLSGQNPVMCLSILF